MITKTKVLIIKLGYSETLDPIISKECSLGDVVRTTVLLNYFRDGDSITWLCDEKAEPLLKNNPYIARVLVWNFETMIQVLGETFDTVINLEKTPAICAFSDKITAWQKYGFRFSTWHGIAEAYINTEKVLEISQFPLKREQNKKFWQEHLAKVIHKHWHLKDKYKMPERSGEIKYDIGLNYKVGKKWPEKAWPMERWQALQVQRGFKVSLQPDLTLEDYMDWIWSCRTLITCDSLGMHLALAYGRNVVALFGPTRSDEVYFYDKGVAIQAENGQMESISVEQVLKVLEEIL